MRYEYELRRVDFKDGERLTLAEGQRIVAVENVIYKGYYTQAVCIIETEVKPPSGWSSL